MARAQGEEVFVDAAVRDTEVWESNHEWWRAFHILCKGRQVYGGMNVAYQRLEYRDVIAHGNAFGFASDATDLEEFVRVMYEMDDVWLHYHEEQAKKKQPKQRADGRPPRAKEQPR